MPRPGWCWKDFNKIQSSSETVLLHLNENGQEINFQKVDRDQINTGKIIIMNLSGILQNSVLEWDAICNIETADFCASAVVNIIARVWGALNASGITLHEVLNKTWSV